MTKYNDPELNELMQTLEHEVNTVVQVLRDNQQTQQVKFLNEFRSWLVVHGFDEQFASQLAGRFDVEIAEGRLDDDDVKAVAKQFADWYDLMYREVIDNQQVDPELAAAITSNAGLSFRI